MRTHGVKQRSSICLQLTMMETQSMTNYEFGEIVLVDFPQSGRVQRKKRPALVVLDVGDADAVLAPITYKRMVRTWGLQN
jgi:hypothetical protein